ncbi:Protein COBRA [Raphanus sativus]|nr:Protein COBRA [Raphanus sativus]
MDSSVSRSTSVVSNLSFLAVLIVFLISSSSLTSTEAYDALDPEGNITMKWDVMSWTPDGYVAVVTMFNFQKYRHIPSPGWTLGWKWAKKEVIWSMVGAQTTEQGDCSKYKGNIPHCGVLNSWVQDPGNAASSFQISVGAAGTTNKTVRVPRNFTLMGPGPGYTCGPAKVVRPTKFVTTDTRRTTQAMMTWNITCTYSQFLAQRTPTCCVSLSSFYNETIVGCPTCACGCQNNRTESGACLDPDTPHLASVVSPPTKKGTILPPLVQCTRHLCPIRVHWHVKQNYKDGTWWHNIRISTTITQIFSFNYKSLTPYAGLNDTAMLWGVKFYNDFLSEAGPLGNVQSEILFRKDQATFSFEKGWAFPRRIYFNGDNCVMPPPDTYPFLPSGGFRPEVSVFASVLLPVLLVSLLLLRVSFILTVLPLTNDSVSGSVRVRPWLGLF